LLMKLPLPIWVIIRGIFFMQMGNIKNIDIFFMRSRIPLNVYKFYFLF